MEITDNFSAKSGATFGKAKAKIYQKCLLKIADKKGGVTKLKPIDVVNEARNKKSPLHAVFDWDDNSAAEKYRLDQARGLIRHILVEVTYDGKVKEQRAWFNINSTPDKEDKNRVYVHVEDVMNKKDYREQVLLGAIQEAEYWQSQYEEFRELNMIFNSIKRTKNKILLKSKSKKGKKKR